MSHTQSHGATNGASLEDCHANFFALVSVGSPGPAGSYPDPRVPTEKNLIRYLSCRVSPPSTQPQKLPAFKFILSILPRSC